MNKDQKAAVVERVASEIEQSEAIFAVDYRGISVKQASELRGSLTDADASFRIVKNTLTERAADQAGAPALKELLEGPTALTFVRGDVATAAKALANFRRQAGLLEFKGGRMGDQPLSPEQIEDIARLPARDVLQGQFVGVLASPLTTLVRGLGSLVSGLAIALKQIEEGGLLAGDAPPASESQSPEPAAEQTPPEAGDEPGGAVVDGELEQTAPEAGDEPGGAPEATTEAAVTGDARDAATEPTQEG